MSLEGPNFNRQETILNDWDRKILVEGGVGVVQKVLEQQGMPDVIIFPETSARPLFYLFDPIFKKAAELKNEQPPRYVFFNVSGTDQYTHTIEKRKKALGQEPATSVDVFQYLEQIFESVDDDASDTDGAFLSALDQVKTTTQKRPVEKTRALEIQEKIGKDSNIVVIDDFAQEGKTEQEINRAFDKTIPYYSMFVDPKNSIHPTDRTGMILTDDIGPNPIANGGMGGLRFSFGTAEKSAIGVKKNIGEKYAIPFHKLKFYEMTDEDRVRMKKLRDEIRMLGMRAAEEFSLKTEEDI